MPKPRTDDPATDSTAIPPGNFVQVGRWKVSFSRGRVTATGIDGTPPKFRRKGKIVYLCTPAEAAALDRTPESGLG